jgi:hypothetical protein
MPVRRNENATDPTEFTDYGKSIEIIQIREIRGIRGVFDSCFYLHPVPIGAW